MPLRGYAALRQILWSALTAGILTGVLMTLVQFVTTVPLIVQAEGFERAVAATETRVSARGVDAAGRANDPGTGHAHDGRGEATPAWAPGEGLERAAYTGLTTALAAVGYGAIVAAVLHLLGVAGSGAGLALGLVGAVVFQWAPALGLPPEPPGGPASDLLARQVWWLGTVVATALAFVCAYLSRTRSKWVWIPAGCVLALLPHAIGAPQAGPGDSSVAPVELARRFAAMAMLTSTIFWAILGATTGYIHARLQRMQPTGEH